MEFQKVISEAGECPPPFTIILTSSFFPSGTRRVFGTDCWPCSLFCAKARKVDLSNEVLWPPVQEQRCDEGAANKTVLCESEDQRRRKEVFEEAATANETQ